MTEEEKAKKLIDANKDLNKGKEISGNFNFSRYHQAKDFIDDCCKEHRLCSIYNDKSNIIRNVW